MLPVGFRATTPRDNLWGIHSPYPRQFTRQIMASYNSFDGRVDSLVVETRTDFADELHALSADDRDWLARAIHQKPHLATQVQYERTHTGFTREITVTAADLERLYADRFSG